MFLFLLFSANQYEHQPPRRRRNNAEHAVSSSSSYHNQPQHPYRGRGQRGNGRRGRGGRGYVFQQAQSQNTPQQYQPKLEDYPYLVRGFTSLDTDYASEIRQQYVFCIVEMPGNPYAYDKKTLKMLIQDIEKAEAERLKNEEDRDTKIEYQGEINRKKLAFIHELLRHITLTAGLDKTDPLVIYADKLLTDALSIPLSNTLSFFMDDDEEDNYFSWDRYPIDFPTMLVIENKLAQDIAQAALALEKTSMTEAAWDGLARNLASLIFQKEKPDSVEAFSTALAPYIEDEPHRIALVNEILGLD